MINYIIAVNYLYIETMLVYHTKMPPKYGKGMANSANPVPDQTAPWSGSAL